MNLENITLSQPDTKEQVSCDFAVTKYLQIHRDKKQNSGVCGAVNRELLFNGYRVSVWNGEKVLEMDNGDGCTTQ